MGLPVIGLLVLGAVAIIVILILARVVVEAARRNPNRLEGAGSDEIGESDGSAGAGREE